VKANAAPLLSREQCHEIALWITANESSMPESVRILFGLQRKYLMAGVELRSRFDETIRELRRALGITASSERRRSGYVLAGVGRVAELSAKDKRYRLEAQRDRSEKLCHWHEVLTKQHKDKAQHLEGKIVKIKDEPMTEPLVESERQGPSELELQLHAQMPVEQMPLTQEQKSEMDATAKQFVERLEQGEGVSDPQLQSVEETLMSAGVVVSNEQLEGLAADLSEQPADAKVVKTLKDKRVRYDITVQVSRIELEVEKQVLVNGAKERTVVSASTDAYGPAHYSVTWTTLGTLAVLVGQFAMPLNRLAKLFSSVGKTFTAGGLSRLLHYVAERFVAIYIELGEQLSDSDIVSGDDTACRVLEVSGYFEKLRQGAEKAEEPEAPWAVYRTRAEAQQSIEACERSRTQQRERLRGEANGEERDRVSLGMLIGRHMDFESERQDGQGAKRSLNTTVMTGRSVASDPRSLIVFYRSHLGGLGNVLESILRNRNPSAKQVIVQADLSTTNLIRDERLLSLFDFKFIGCSAHARRPFALYEQQDPVYCAFILHLFTGLAMYEERLDAHGRNWQNVLAVRQHDSRKLWEQIREVAVKLESRWSKESKLGAGARYVIKHYDKLTAYLDDPRLQPTNNLQERMLRTEKLIENSSMFRKSLEGRFVLDIIRTILQTAVAAGVPVHEYLVSVLRSDPDEVAQHPERFTPRAWAARKTSEQAS